MRPASAAAAAALVLVTGCGGGGSPSTARPLHPTAAERHGRALFVRTCGACHAFADAGTDGSAGPRLDDHPRREVFVREVIASGPGLMPAGLLDGVDADAVAAYVAAASRR